MNAQIVWHPIQMSWLLQMTNYVTVHFTCHKKYIKLPSFHQKILIDLEKYFEMYFTAYENCYTLHQTQ